MPIVAGDIDFHLSGGAGNTDPNAALGGAISTTQLTDNTLNNLWDDVSGAESSAGDTEYRCIYVKNAHGTLTLQSAKIWIETNTTSPANAMSIALGGEGMNGTAETVANESTAPVGETFSQPTNYAGGLSLGNLTAGSTYPIWVKRVIPASTSAVDNVTYVLKVQGDTAA
ncbi:MAG: hypothetical protein DA330_09515 [Nitrososphaera sp.]|nr:hypothetical protein [Nitrososphaera sp.]